MTHFSFKLIHISRIRFWLWKKTKKKENLNSRMLLCKPASFPSCTAAPRERQRSSAAYLWPTVTDGEQTLWEKRVYCSLPQALLPMPPLSLAFVQKAQREELKRKGTRTPRYPLFSVVLSLVFSFQLSAMQWLVLEFQNSNEGQQTTTIIFQYSFVFNVHKKKGKGIFSFMGNILQCILNCVMFGLI